MRKAHWQRLSSCVTYQIPIPSHLTWRSSKKSWSNWTLTLQWYVWFVIAKSVLSQFWLHNMIRWHQRTSSTAQADHLNDSVWFKEDDLHNREFFFVAKTTPSGWRKEAISCDKNFKGNSEFVSVKLSSFLDSRCSQMMSWPLASPNGQLLSCSESVLVFLYCSDISDSSFLSFSFQSCCQ